MLGRETDSIQAQARGQTLGSDVDLRIKECFGFRGVAHWSSIFPVCPQSQCSILRTKTRGKVVWLLTRGQVFSEESWGRGGRVWADSRKGKLGM